MQEGFQYDVLSTGDREPSSLKIKNQPFLFILMTTDEEE